MPAARARMCSVHALRPQHALHQHLAHHCGTPSFWGVEFNTLVLFSSRWMPSRALKSFTGSCGACLAGLPACRRLFKKPKTPPARAGAARTAPSKAKPKAVFSSWGVPGTGPAKCAGMMRAKLQSLVMSSIHRLVCAAAGPQSALPHLQCLPAAQLPPLRALR